jgi:hypothetical protein
MLLGNIFSTVRGELYTCKRRPRVAVKSHVALTRQITKPRKLAGRGCPVLNSKLSANLAKDRRCDFRRFCAV